MESIKFKVLLEWDKQDKVWVSYVPTLDHISTFGETRDEALANTKEAILGYLEAAKKEGIQINTEGIETELLEVEVVMP